MKKFTKGMRRKAKKMREKNELVNPKVLIVALDLAKKNHACWFTNYFRTPLYSMMIPNTREGMVKTIRKAEAIKEEQNLKRVLFVMEPTSYLWMIVANILEGEGYRYRLVQPISIWRERDADDWSFAKSDMRDAELIAKVALKGDLTKTQLEGGIFGELRSCAFLGQKLVTERAAVKDEIRSLLNLIFPNYFDAVKTLTAKVSLAVFKTSTNPNSIRLLAFEEFLERVSQNYDGPRLSKKILKKIWQVALQAEGMSNLEEIADFRLKFAVRKLEFLSTQIDEVEEKLEELLKRSGYREMINSIKGISIALGATLLGFIGDPRKYDASRCLPKLAGTSPRDNSSGEFKGKRTISKRGRSGLRVAAFEAAYSLVRHNPEFKARYRYLQKRENNPLTKKQALVAVANKLLRTLHVMLSKRIPYSPAIATGFELIPDGELTCLAT